MNRMPRICVNTDCKRNNAGIPAYRVNIGYVDCVVAAGGLPVLVPCVAEDAARDEYMADADGFLFIGGADWPPALYGRDPHPKTVLQDEQRVRADKYLVRAALAGDAPVLGICAGMQLLHIATGGALIQHLETADAHVAPKEHSIDVVPGTRLAALCGGSRAQVNSRHHQGVDDSTVHESFSVTARAPDGVVEAIEMKGDRFVFGAQWHPEFMPERGQLHNPALTRALFGEFVDHARRYARAREAAS